MKTVFVSASNILSPLGRNTADNFMQLTKGISGLQKHHDKKLSTDPFCASLFKEDQIFYEGSQKSGCTKFENLLIGSIKDALQHSTNIPYDKSTILIISTTKGNIDLLQQDKFSEQLKERMALTTSANLVAKHLQFINKPIVISNACISGLLAIITGMRLLQSGQYQTAVIAGADIISKFVLSGFQSFQAVSKEFCKPFDADRDGINLGEAAGTIVLTTNKNSAGDMVISGGAVSNDANHISGPSRTGEELKIAILKAMQSANLSAAAIDFISAHGTATLYNDQMEANAFALSGLQRPPVNSLKGYFGHTLGAAGIIESIVSLCSLQQNKVLPTVGFKKSGISQPINICATLQDGPLKNCLKTAAGFGGCNAAIILSKQ